MLSIITDVIDSCKILSEIKDRSAGGTVLFVGTVRDHNDKGPVFEIQYEAYKAMAESRITEIEEEIRKKWKINKIIIVHRIGSLDVGEVSVAVAVSAEHRKEAFEACKYCIDAIKTSVPIWKKEVSESEKTWVEGVAPKSG